MAKKTIQQQQTEANPAPENQVPKAPALVSGDTDQAVSAITDAATDAAMEAEQSGRAEDTGTQAVPTQAQDGQAHRLRAEAKGLRSRLRAVEAERDQLAAQVSDWQRKQAETLAGQTLANGMDLWAGGVSLLDLLDETGQLDPALVEQAARQVATERPHWRKLRPNFDQGHRPAPATQRGWSELIGG